MCYESILIKKMVLIIHQVTQKLLLEVKASKINGGGFGRTHLDPRDHVGIEDDNVLDDNEGEL